MDREADQEDGGLPFVVGLPQTVMFLLYFLLLHFLLSSKGNACLPFLSLFLLFFLSLPSFLPLQSKSVFPMLKSLYVFKLPTVPAALRCLFIPPSPPLFYLKSI